MPKRVCAAYPRCTVMVQCGYCQACEKKRPAVQYDRDRGTSAQRGYNSRWRKYRLAYFAEHPLCVDPDGRHPEQPREATHLDHKTPHVGAADGWKLFWDPKNHQGLCESCHNHKTATRDGGFGNRK